MKQLLWIAFWLIPCAAGFCESLPLTRMGSPFRCSNLEVKWNVASNALPAEVWIFKLTPVQFSPSAISNLMVSCAFTSKDKVQDDTNALVFKTQDNSRQLSISFAEGRIDYQADTHYGPTNLTKEVPPMNQLPLLTTNFLKSIGFDCLEVEKDDNGKPSFNFSEPLTLYHSNQTTITNIEWRAVRFRRTLDGAALVGSNCEIDFGEYGKVSKISFPWIGVERHQKCKVAEFEKIAAWIRSGRAVQGRIPWDSKSIQWPEVKRMTVNKIKLCYQPTAHFVYPLLALWTTIETDTDKRDIEIDCPLIAEAQP